MASSDRSTNSQVLQVDFSPEADGDRPQSIPKQFHDLDDLHSYLIRSWNELSPSERVNDPRLYTSNEHEAASEIVTLILLDSLSQVLGSDVAKAQSLIFPVLYYFLLGEVMPGLIGQILKLKLEEVVEMLSARNEDVSLPSWLVLSEPVNAAVSRVLKEWVDMMSSSERGPSVKTVREAVVQRERRQDGLSSSTPAGCEKEIEFHRRIGLLAMNWASHDMFYEEELRRAFAEFDFTSSVLTNGQLLEAVDAAWIPNPRLTKSLPPDNTVGQALCDSDNRLPGGAANADSNGYLSTLRTGRNPADFANSIECRGAKAPEDQGLMEYTSYWFNGIAHAIAGLKDDLKVEVAIFGAS
ncbi:hypothetical protein TI39_contig373g00013 [Zymoseptoria brevis]|uniref:Uncharacterized protein n=1 Tax=Zymoseptoria brevis TaxID=1047168 RepID=A0A0F4GPF5_9PEZI|nr:hypothetical protein TI39_contig373g00013 [Zymoseptoria brevis]